MNSKLLAAAMIVVAVIAGLLYFSSSKTNPTTTDSSLETQGISTDNTTGLISINIQVALSDTETSSYPVNFNSGKTLKEVMDILSISNENFSYKTETASFGEYLTTVNGITPNAANNEFWNIRINGADSMVGISEYIPQAGDQILFKITKF